MKSWDFTHKLFYRPKLIKEENKKKLKKRKIVSVFVIVIIIFGLIAIIVSIKHRTLIRKQRYISEEKLYKELILKKNILAYHIYTNEYGDNGRFAHELKKKAKIFKRERNIRISMNKIKAKQKRILKEKKALQKRIIQEKKAFEIAIKTNKVRIKLRSGYKKLSYNQAISMIKSKGFYDYKLNINGEFVNNYAHGKISDDNVVIDSATGLMWPQSGSSGEFKWSKVEEWVRLLNKQGYAGYSDWRLPTLEEGVSLLENSKNKNSLYIDNRFSATQKNIWTGDSSSDSYVSNGFIISFSRGCIYLSHKTKASHKNHIRPVRSQ